MRSQSGALRLGTGGWVLRVKSAPAKAENNELQVCVGQIAILFAVRYLFFAVRLGFVR